MPGRRALGRRTGLVFANTIVGAVLGFVALKVLAVEAGELADGLLGQLAFALGIAGMLSILADLGLGTAHIKRISEGRELADATATYAAVKLALCLGFIALVAAAAFAAQALGVLVDVPRVAVVVVAAHFAFLGLRGIFTATFDGRQEFAKTQFTVLTEHVVRVVLTLGFAFAFAGAVLGTGPLSGSFQDGLSGFRGLVLEHAGELLAFTYAGASFASVLAGWWFFRRGYPLGKVRPDILRDYWGFARHLFVAMAVGTIYVSFDRVIVTAFWTTENAGRYFAAQRFSDLIGMVPLAVYAVLFPALSSSYARGDTARVRAALEASLRHVSMIVVPLVVFAMALAGPLLSLVLTGVFEPAVPTVQVLALFALVYALFYPYVTLLNALDRPDLTARIGIVGAVVNVVLNLVLVPAPGTFGLPLLGMAEVGSALATLVAMSLQFVLVRRAVHGLHGPVPEHHVVKHLAGGAVMLAALTFLAPRVLPPGQAPFALMLVLLAVGVAVYLGVLVLLREFTRRDLDLYLHIANPAAMARYVADEVQSHGPGGPPRGAGPPPGPGT